ncbi:MAG: HDIG domain-containing protein [Armatimonadetes bacterium]|nr:HDIG domain-containing protein [Armatimonadota bacterium]
MTPAERIAQATLETQWEGGLWLVGGAVRDPLLGLLPPSEIDIVLEGDSADLAMFLWEQGVSTIQPVTYPRFGTALVCVEGGQVEIVTARSESYHRESRKPAVEPATLKEDALRRDFTINTLLKNLHTDEMRDPLGVGLADLQQTVLRTPLEPDATFFDDPLRMLRAVRFKNRFGFHFAQGLGEAISEHAGRLKIISGERIRDELTKMLLASTTPQSLRDLMTLGLLDVFASEFSEGIGVDQGSYHTKNVWEHTLDVVGQVACKASLLVILGALFHDIGKPRTRSVDTDGRVRFFGHDKVGAEMTFEILMRLRFSRKTSADVAKIVFNHMRLGSAVPFTTAAARRLTRDMGPLLGDFLTVCEADAASLRAAPKGIDFDDVRAKLAAVRCLTRNEPLESPLSGAEIMRALGLPEGPEVGMWKRKLTEAVLDGRLDPGDREGALTLLREKSSPEDREGPGEG